MAGAPAGLPAGVRLSDHISLGVIARAVPPDRVRQVLAETGKASERERDLAAQVVVYYAIALALYMGSSTREVLRCLLEGLRWLWGAEAVKVAGKSGISQARTRLGEAPLRRLYEDVVRPIATPATKGAWYRTWRPVSLDGTCLDVADTAANRAEFGRPGGGRGESAFPQLRVVALVENGTHVLFGACLGRCAEGETTLARGVLGADHAPRPAAGAGGGAGRALPRALGDRGHARRAEDAAARGAGSAAQQDPGPGPPGGLGPAAGALRGARADARSRPAGRRGPGPALLLARRARGPAQAGAVRGAPPLGPGLPCMRRCWTRSWKSARSAAAAGRCRAGSNAQ
jgi:hypothetical protein